MPLVLGVDPGTLKTGYGVVRMEGNKLSHVAHGVISTRSSEELPLRLKTIYKGLREVIAEFGPAEAGVESIFHARNAQSALKLGHARGVILLALEEEHLPIGEYSPMQVKSAVVGYGRATKEQVQDMVQRLLKLPKKAPEDASDALAVAICHGRSRTMVQAVVKSQLGVRR